jgi:Cu(I)/Ag(I) efflux system membrane protein CusA/SilA
VQDVIGTALGGEMVTTTVEGRERFGVTVRYPRALRDDPQQIAARCWCPTMGGAMDAARPGGRGRACGARPAGHPHRERAAAAYIFVDIRDRDIGGYVKPTRRRRWPTGEVPARLLHHLERPVRVHGARQVEKMKIVVPVTC